MKEYNTVKYWDFFSEKEIRENEGKLLMLDIDFGRRCSLNCPSCFRKRKGIFNCGCPPKDGITLTKRLYPRVLTRIKQHMGMYKRVSI